jgi:hypothetical protein
MYKCCEECGNHSSIRYTISLFRKYPFGIGILKFKENLCLNCIKNFTEIYVYKKLYVQIELEESPNGKR